MEGRVIYNKNVSSSAEIKDAFSSSSTLNIGEIVLLTDENERGIWGIKGEKPFNYTGADNIKITSGYTGSRVTSGSTIEGAFSQIEGAVDNAFTQISEISNNQYVVSGSDTVSITQEGTKRIFSSPTITLKTDKYLTGETANHTLSISANVKTVSDSTESGYLADVYDVKNYVDAVKSYVDQAQYIKLSGITPTGTNVREEYALINKEGTQLGDTTVKIYKDSSLYDVHLGHIDDKFKNETVYNEEPPTAYNEEFYKIGTGDTSLSFVYLEGDGRYHLVGVNLSKFLEESEFQSGVTADVETHIVHGVVDNQSGDKKYLYVGGNGFFVSGVTDAIGVAVNGIKAFSEVETDEGSIGAQTNTETISIKGDDYISLKAVDNGVKAAANVIAEKENFNTVSQSGSLVDALVLKDVIEANANAAAESANTLATKINETTDKVESIKGFAKIGDTNGSYIEASSSAGSLTIGGASYIETNNNNGVFEVSAKAVDNESDLDSLGKTERKLLDANLFKAHISSLSGSLKSYSDEIYESAVTVSRGAAVAADKEIYESAATFTKDTVNGLKYFSTFSNGVNKLSATTSAATLTMSSAGYIFPDISPTENGGLVVLNLSVVTSEDKFSVITETGMVVDGKVLLDRFNSVNEGIESNINSINTVKGELTTRIEDAEGSIKTEILPSIETINENIKELRAETSQISRIDERLTAVEDGLKALSGSVETIKTTMDAKIMEMDKVTATALVDLDRRLKAIDLRLTALEPKTNQ